ncbi:biotin-dependent carboxyltransferase family protein [Kutzneria albida]|uniref:Allophanate hydrolase n=1 Tax=Kutzneria albida DSM 43870 TaxID=1449976 RepID=W5VZ41_9PSEU|nr:biotin-dependent carboxyltransferase family protein [Kutzneria albida]AHH94168.1 allophanate hydrolase [Kutzneria albida DSM 43870]
MIEVLAAGPLGTVQDLGREGLAHLGVGRSGAADRPAAALANRLVGNPGSAAVLELTFGGLHVRLGRGVLAALTGAPCPVTVSGRAVGSHAPFWVHAGEELRVGAPVRGLRSYLAVRGGVAVEPVLRSRSTDLLSGLGPPPLAPGMVLPIGEDRLDWPAADLAPQAELPEVPTLSVLPGPRLDWFAADALRVLCARPYVVSGDSNRIGVRLTGAALPRLVERQLPSEAVVSGAVQVPPSGQPIVFLADHPVTGGYPVIGVVDEVPAAAQVRPGQQVRFRVAKP